MRHSRVKRIQVCSNEGPHLFPREDDNKIGKIHWGNLNFFLLQTNGLISTKLDTKNLWVNKIQFCLNEGPHIFPRGDNNEIAKVHFRNSSSPEPQGWFQTNILGWRGFKFVQRGRLYWNSKNTLMKSKNCLLQNQWTNIDLHVTWCNVSLCEGDSNFYK